MKRNISATNGTAYQIMFGIVTAIGVCVVTALIGPIFILNEYLAPTSVHIIMMIAQGVGAFIGALISAANMKERK